MAFWEPEPGQIAELRRKALLDAKGDPQLADNFLYAAIFGREAGLFGDTDDYKPTWERGVYTRRRLRRREWIERYFPIRDKAGRIVNLKLKPAQRRLETAILRAERAGLPVRLQILKARQQGFCYDPAMRVLTDDLRWVPIGDIRPGQLLVACDESVPGGRGAGRRMRTAEVEVVARLRANAFRITMDDGRQLVATAGHRHLCRLRSGTGTQWRPVSKLRVGDHIRHIATPWEQQDVDDAWAGGLIDGEGCLRRKKSGGVSLTVSQVRGPVFSRLVNHMRRLGVVFREDLDERQAGAGSKLGKQAVASVTACRGNEMFMLIGKLRPVRFIGKRWWDGVGLPGSRSGVAWSRVVSIDPVGQRDMVDLQTSTKTFVCEGFVSHNSSYVQGVKYERTLRGKLVRCLIVANSNDQSKILLEMVRVARTQMRKGRDERWDFAMRSKAAGANVFDVPIDGAIKVESAETDNAGRGGTLTIAHMSETSRFPQNKTTYADVLASLPAIPGTFGFDESTACGDTGRFARDFWHYWSQRHKPLELRQDNWSAIFSPWFDEPGYAWSQTFGSGRELPQQMIDEIMASLDEEETWLLKQTSLRRWQPDSEWERVLVSETSEIKMSGTGRDATITGTRMKRHDPPLQVWRRKGVGHQPVTVDQLAWRRFKIADKEIGRDVNLFDQEYPSRPEVAFRASGRPVFDISVIDRKLAAAADRKPVFTGDLRTKLVRATPGGVQGTDASGSTD